MLIDDKTKAMYHDLHKRRKAESPGGIPWPLVKANSLMREGEETVLFRWLYRQENFRETIESYGRGRYYSECYRCLAYMLYGYGYLSNNERRMAGLKPKRMRRRR